MTEHAGRVDGRRRWVPLLAAWPAALVGVVAVALLGGGPSGERPSPGASESASPTARPTARSASSAAPRPNANVTPVAIAPGPMALVAGLGRIWVASASDSTVRAVDPRSARVVLVASAPGSAVSAASPPSIAVAGGAVWAAGLPDATVLLRIDPASGQVSQRTTLDAPIAGILGDERGVWVTTDAGVVVRVDPATGAVTASVGQGGDPVYAALGATSLWVSSGREVLRVNPIHGRVRAEIRGGGGPIGVLDGTVWARAPGSVSPGLVSLEEATGTVLERADIATSGRGDLAWALPGLEPARLSDNASRYAPRDGQFVELADVTWLARPDLGEVWRIEGG